jgi:hypothetical protein
MDPLVEKEFALRLQLPNHAIFVGASMSGKTTLLLRILDCIDCLHPVPKTVLFYYDQYQDSYQELKRRLAARGVEMSLRQGHAPSLEGLEKKEHQTLIIIDDATEETASSSEIAKITTNGRHKNASVWLLWHSLYSKHAASRLITQNVAYMFFLPSVRLTSQIHSLDTQLRYKGRLVAAYQLAVEAEARDQRYLLLDLAATTPSSFRLRSSVTQPHQTMFM